MEKAINGLGEVGWELVSVIPIDLKMEGYSDVTLGYGGGESSGKFERIAAYFKKEVLRGVISLDGGIDYNGDKRALSR